MISLSPDAQRAREELHRQDAPLTAYDFSEDCVRIQHEDGTSLFITNAFLREWEGWVFVFCEHMEALYFHKSDLLFWEMLSPHRNS